METGNSIEKVKAMLVDVDQEIVERTIEKLNTFNENRSCEKAYYVIGVTGCKRVYYTLWRVNVYNRFFYSFVQNLSISLVEAVNTAMKLTQHSDRVIEIDDIRTLKYDYNVEILKQGKYKDCLLSDVFKQDPQYIVWLNKNYIATTKKTQEFKQLLESYSDMYFEWLKKEHEKNPTYYIGTMGEKINNLDLTIYRIVNKKEESDFSHKFVCTTFLYCNTDNGNKVILKFGTDKFGIEFEKDMRIKMERGKVMKQYEYIGYKYTQFGFIKNIQKL